MFGKLIPGLAVLVMCGAVVAQESARTQEGTGQSNPPTQSAPTSTRTGADTKIAPGSVIPVQLTKGIDAKKAKSGDAVEAKVTQDLKTNSGDVIVAKDTKVLGHVTEAQARNKEQKESQVGIAFDHAVLKDGANISLPLSIQAVISALPMNGGNNAANQGAGPSPSGPSSGGVAPSTGSRMGTPGGTPPPQAPSVSDAGGTPSSQSGAYANEPITGKTEGVVGIANLKLSTPGGTQGSVLSSEKNNVKLDSGTLMLLRVNQ